MRSVVKLLGAFATTADKRIERFSVKSRSQVINVSDAGYYWKGEDGSAGANNAIEVLVESRTNATPHVIGWDEKEVRGTPTPHPFTITQWKGTPLPMDAIRRVSYAMAKNASDTQLEGVHVDWKKGVVVALDSYTLAICPINGTSNDAEPLWIPRQVVLGILALPKKNPPPTYRVSGKYIEIYANGTGQLDGIHIMYPSLTKPFPNWEEHISFNGIVQQSSVNPTLMLNAIKSVRPTKTPKKWNDSIYVSFKNGTVQWGKDGDIELFSTTPNADGIETRLDPHVAMKTIKQFNSDFSLIQNGREQFLLMEETKTGFRAVMSPKWWDL